MHGLVTLTFTAEAQGDADGVHQFKPPRDLTIVGVDVVAEAFTGSPTAFDIDLQDDGTDVITAVSADTAGTVGTWRSTHFGGSETPVTVDGDSTIDVDVNLTGGTTPTADYTIVIYALMGAV